MEYKNINILVRDEKFMFNNIHNIIKKLFINDKVFLIKRIKNKEILLFNININQKIILNNKIYIQN